MALLSWILISTTLAVSSAVKPDIFQNARCQAFCKTQYPQQVVLGSLKYVVCNSTDCQECVKPCSLDFVSFNACNTSCSGSSACEASCDFLKDALFGNVPFEKNISSPGKPIAQGTNFTSIELSWSPPNGTSTIGVVYIVMMSYGGDLSSNGWIRLNQVFHTPGAVISEFYLCKNITGFNETVGPRETYNGIYYKFYVIAVTLQGAPAAGDPSDKIQLQRPDAPGNVTFNLVRYGPMGLGFDELQFQGSWTAPAAHISRYFIVWNGSNCYSTPGNYIRRYSTTDQKITFYLPYEQKTGCQNEFKVYALVGCSVSLAETVVVTNPGCRNVSSFPTWKCCSVDPPMALGAEELMVQNLTRGPFSLGNDCRFTFKISWDPPLYLARTGCNALFVIYSYRYGDPRVPGPWGRIDYTVNNEVELDGIDPGILFKFEIHANIKFNPEVISQINFTVPSSGPETKVQNLTLTLVTDSSGARSIVAEWENPTYSSCVSHFLLNFTFGDGTYITAIINITTYTIPVPENSVPPLTNAFPVGNMAAPRSFTLTVTPLFTNPLLIGIPATISASIPPLGDTNECMTNNGGCNQTCVNTVGSFFCACRPGYMLSADNQTCLDINECMMNNGGCNQICVNTEGSYMCACKPGYILSADNKTCLDIDECVTSNGGCNQICMNTMGSYKCLCKPGYMLSADNQTCVDMNECMMNNGGCSQFCINTPGSYQCFCRPGYKLAMDFKTCLDIDECTTTNKGGCSDICYNILGSYKCFCKPGSQLQPDGKTCKPTVTTCQLWYCKTGYYGYGYGRYYRYRYRPIYAVCHNGQLQSCAGNGYYYYKPYNIPCRKCHLKGYWNKYYHVKKSWKMFGRRGKKFRGFG